MGFLRIFVVLLYFFSSQAFSSSDECKEAVTSSSETQSPELENDPVVFAFLDSSLFVSIKELELSSLSQNILEKHQIHYIGDLVKRTKTELIEMFHSEKQAIRDYIYAVESGTSFEYSTVSEEISWQINKIKRELSEFNLKLQLGMDHMEWWPSDPKKVKALIKKHKQIDSPSRPTFGSSGGLV